MDPESDAYLDPDYDVDPDPDTDPFLIPDSPIFLKFRDSQKEKKIVFLCLLVFCLNFVLLSKG
jgi:hypothetical protein